MKRLSAVLAVALATASLRGHELTLASPCEASGPKVLAPFKDEADAYVFLDLTAEKPQAYVHAGKPSGVLDALKADCRDKKEFAGALDKVPELGPATTEARLMLRKNRVIDVYAFFRAECSVPPFTLSIEEASRPTEFVRGLKVLAEAGVQNVKPEKEAEKVPPVQVVHDQYQLIYDRAHATLSMKSKEGEAKASDLVKLITGAPEHWTWSANLPLNSVRQLKFNSDKQQLQTRETPKEFLAGIDLYRGDVLTTYRRADWNRVHLKGLVRFSRTPLDSAGLAAAYRTPWADVFTGPLWIKEDASDGTRTRYRMRWRVGVGFDVGIVREWVK